MASKVLAASVPSEASASRPAAPARREFLALLAGSLLATLPLWLATYPPMTDLPSHASQVMLLRNLYQPGFPFRDLFEINWFTPYLLGYGMVYALVPLLGIVAACKTVVALALVGLPLSTWLLLRETDADPRWAWLTLPAMYNFAYAWGFLNFLVAIPCGIVFLVFAMRHARRARLSTGIALALMINVLFFSHALIAAFFGAAAVLYAVQYRRSLRQGIRCMLPLLTLLPLAIAWLIVNRHQPLPEGYKVLLDLGWFATGDGYYGDSMKSGIDSMARLSGFAPRLIGFRPSLLCYLAVLLIFALPFLDGGRYAGKKSPVWAPFWVCLAVLLLAPHILLGTYYIYHRFTVMALPLFLMALERDRRPVLFSRRLLYPACALLLCLWLAVSCRDMLAFNRLAAGFRAVEADMQPGQRALGMTFRRNDDHSIAPPFLHFGAWYAAEKDGLEDPSSAASFYMELVRYRRNYNPPARPVDFDWVPEKFFWTRFDGDSYRYFLVKAKAGVQREIFRGAPCPPRLAGVSGDWQLFERDRSCFGAVR